MSSIIKITDLQSLNIGYTLIESPVGRLIVGATDVGICYGGFDECAAMDDIKSRYPNAIFTQGIESRHLEAIERFMHGEAAPMTFHVHGTDFQLRVWRELLTIPFAGTSSYSAIATQAGRPKAVRAVGSAVGSNPVSLFIPCHRVLRSDGSLGGYFWGEERKKALLSWEAFL